VCPATHRLIGAVLTEAGLGEGVVNVVTHDPKDAEAIAEALISHHAVKRVNFTGSTRVGKIITGIAAKYLKPVLLELGGKAPLLVLDDADLDAAVDATVFGAFANSGQICMSTERVIVDEKVADQFAAKLAKRVAALPTGDPRKGDFVLGSVVGKPTVERVQKLVSDAAAKGAKVLCGGESDGTIMKGIVVDRVTPEMALFREESFGPQVSITRVNTDYTIGDAFQQSHRVVSGHDGVRGIVLHSEILAFRDGIENGEKNLLLLGELGVSPEAVLVVILQAEHDPVFARHRQQGGDGFRHPLDALLPADFRISLAGKHPAHGPRPTKYPRHANHFSLVLDCVFTGIG